MSGISDEAYARLDTFATGGPDGDIETLRGDVMALLGAYDTLAGVGRPERDEIRYDEPGWLMRSLEQATRRAAQLPQWARDIEEAVDRQYNRPAAEARP